MIIIFVKFVKQFNKQERILSCFLYKLIAYVDLNSWVMLKDTPYEKRYSCQKYIAHVGRDVTFESLFTESQNNCLYVA